MELNNIKTRVKGGEDDDEKSSFPASPSAQFFTSSVLSISVIAVLEAEVPIDDSCTMSMLKDVFLPINPRFSSIMVRDKNGEKEWKKVEVNLKDHIKVPIFQKGKAKENLYDNCFNEYVSKICLEHFPESRPLWELHIIKYPTSNAAGTVIFKLHHSLGDGYSLMGALLSCLQRADNPLLPLTFPGFNRKQGDHNKKGRIPQLLSGIVNTLSDFAWGLLKSTSLEDDKSPVRSGNEGLEFKPIEITTMAFSLDQIKQIKTHIDVTINDIMCGVLFLGIRLYMDEMKSDGQRNANPNALVMLNTRNIGGYKSIDEMLRPKEDCMWGNQFAFLYVPIPPLAQSESALSFIFKAQQVVQRQRNSSVVYLNGKLIQTMHNIKGAELTAKYMHSTLINSTVTISNMFGPTEQMSLANQPVKGLYFSYAGVPQSLTIAITSYMRTVRVALGTEKGFIDSHKLKSCIQNAFDTIFKAATHSEN